MPRTKVNYFSQCPVISPIYASDPDAEDIPDEKVPSRHPQYTFDGPSTANWGSSSTTCKCNSHFPPHPLSASPAHTSESSHSFSFNSLFYCPRKGAHFTDWGLCVKSGPQSCFHARLANIGVMNLEGHVQKCISVAVFVHAAVLQPGSYEQNRPPRSVFVHDSPDEVVAKRRCQQKA